MRYPAYPEYKDSGVQWLGRVPVHWQSVCLKWISQRYAGGTPDKSNDAYWDEGDIPWLNSGSVNDGYITEPSAFITPEGFANSSAKWIPATALVMALAGQGKTKGMVAQLGIRATCNQSMAAIIPNDEFAPRFLYWWLVSNYQNIRNMAGGEQRDGLNLDLLGAIPCPLIPLREQTAIADFLDRDTGRIDTLVAKKRRLIALLKEKRTALISRTVTRGLPDAAACEFGLEPHARFRDSDIEWLGELPEGWEVKKLGHLSVIVRGASPRPAGDPRYFDGDYIPWITVGEVTKDTNVFLESTESMLTEEGASCSRTIASGILVITNSGATLGVPKILKFTGCANDGIVAFENMSEKVDIYFVYYFLTSITTNLRNRLKQGGGQPNLNTDLIKAISIPFPSKAEQTAIAAYLDRETAKIDRLVEKVDAAIARLHEYRTALITAAVTGKIDVRGAVA